jgi:hypothetical protein
MDFGLNASLTEDSPPWLPKDYSRWLEKDRIYRMEAERLEVYKQMHKLNHELEYEIKFQGGASVHEKPDFEAEGLVSIPIPIKNGPSKREIKVRVDRLNLQIKTNPLPTSDLEFPADIRYDSIPT